MPRSQTPLLAALAASLCIMAVFTSGQAAAAETTPGHTSGGSGSAAICTTKEWWGGKAVMTGSVVNGTHTVAHVGWFTKGSH